MRPRLSRGLLIWACLVGGFVSAPVGAQDAGSAPGRTAAPEAGLAGSADSALIDAMTRDPRLSLSRPAESNLSGNDLSEGNLRVPLTPREWSFGGLRPYAALNARALRPVTEGSTTLATPTRDSSEDIAHGLGVGAGLQWQLSQRFGLFGEYLFRASPATTGPANNPTLRPDAEAPSGVKGGLSIRF